MHNFKGDLTKQFILLLFFFKKKKEKSQAYNFLSLNLNLNLTLYFHKKLNCFEVAKAISILERAQFKSELIRPVGRNRYFVELIFLRLIIKIIIISRLRKTEEIK
jgi:hypothetical protein